VVKVNLLTFIAGSSHSGLTRRFESPPSKRPRRVGHPAGTRGCSRAFTLLEILVVLAILGFVLALVLPRIGRLPRQLLIQNGLSQIRMAFRDAGTKARASGKPTRLILSPESHEFRIENGLAQGAQTAELGGISSGNPGSPEGGRETPGFLSKLSSYKVPTEIAWNLDDVLRDDSGTVTYSFFPGGEASGSAVEFELGDSHFVLDIDRLTGRPIIDELE
jgi:prepilin-type N-terminal cleavage/methylation domain-containing protein